MDNITQLLATSIKEKLDIVFKNISKELGISEEKFSSILSKSLKSNVKSDIKSVVKSTTENTESSDDSVEDEKIYEKKKKEVKKENGTKKEKRLYLCKYEYVKGGGKHKAGERCSVKVFNEGDYCSIHSKNVSKGKTKDKVKNSKSKILRKVSEAQEVMEISKDSKGRLVDEKYKFVFNNDKFIIGRVDDKDEVRKLNNDDIEICITNNYEFDKDCTELSKIDNEELSETDTDSSGED